MPKKKVSLEQWKKGKEFKMWERLYEMCKRLGMSGGNFISLEDLGGLYWEPFFELLFKFGNILKKVGKLKEIKMDWMRPINYLGAQSDVDVVFDNEKYKVPKSATGSASIVRFDFQHVLDRIYRIEILDDSNFQKEYKSLHSDMVKYFKDLYSFVFLKDENNITGFRYLHENIKLILKPLRMLRKSGYRLFSVERNELNYEDLIVFQDKKQAKLFVEGVGTFMKNEAYKQQKDCNVDELENFMGNALKREYYEYKFNDKIHVEEVEKDDKGVEKKEKRKEKEKKKTISPEELARIMQEEERKQLTLINIKELKEGLPNTFIKEALQKDFEDGFDAMFKFLNKKVAKDFPDEVVSHKIFVNLFQIPDGRKIPQIDFYLGQLNTFIENMKVKCYEMKLNGLSRILIPIQANEEFVKLLKQIYDIHKIIDRILGDKLLYEQYLFIFDCIKFVIESNYKEELEIYRTKELIEIGMPRYIFFQSMVHSANVLQNFQKYARKDGGHFDINNFFQPKKHEIDGPYTEIALNAYEMTDLVKKGLTAEYIENEKLFWAEVNKFGRFWLMEYYFPPDDREKWLEAIEILSNVNKLVQEDIRDMILLRNDKVNETTDKKSTTNLKTNINDTSQNTNENSADEKKTSKEKSKEKGGKIGKKHSSNIQKKGAGHKGITSRKSIRKISIDSNDEKNVLPKNIDNLRPPNVWNYPVERIEKIKNDMKKKKKIKNQMKLI